MPSLQQSDLPYSSRSTSVKVLYTFAKDQFFDFDHLSCRQFSRVLNTLFWASLKKEEGRHVVISLVVLEPEYLNPNYGIHRLVFSNLSPFSMEPLVKLSAGLAGTDSSIEVCTRPTGRMDITGISVRPVTGLVLRILEVGHIVLYNGVEVFAEIKPGPEVHILDPWLVPDWVFQIERYLRRLERDGSAERGIGLAWHLRYLAKAIQHGRGGTLLIVPKGDKDWRKSVEIAHEIGRDSLRFLTLAENWTKESKQLTKKDAKANKEPIGLTYMWPDIPEERSFSRAVEAIGQLTAVDGATILDSSFRVLGFGAKIQKLHDMPETVIKKDPLDAYDYHEVSLSDLGGTRHSSAAQFVYDNPETIALVASQDGHMTLFSGADGIVTAVRCETLLRS